MAKFLIKDRPTLTCMVQAHTPERAFELINKGLENGTDAFGLQLEQLERQYHNKQVYTEIFKAMKDKPCYVTDYNFIMNEGFSDDELAEDLLLAAQCGGALIDVTGDFFDRVPEQLTYNETAVKKQIDFIDKIHKLGKEVLISTHDTNTFYDYDRAYKVLSAQKSRGADICKLVTASNTEKEFIKNTETSAKLALELRHPFLFLGVGETCAKHRRLAPFISNDLFLCVAEHDELSTPSQPLLKDAKKLLDLIK